MSSSNATGFVVASCNQARGPYRFAETRFAQPAGSSLFPALVTDSSGMSRRSFLRQHVNIVFGKSKQEHLANLTIVLRRIKTVSLKLNHNFRKIKFVLSSNKVFQMFDASLPMIVFTDASDIGLGDVLQQLDGHRLRTINVTGKRCSARGSALATFTWKGKKKVTGGQSLKVSFTKSQ
ncbi:hypothetical protein HPB47_001168 [Ixodes persulcatus]|uniref:Uncharacterized protein n=1 Tax=Ixodes persulcatus TaxID=34615 RepID=A0AC60PPR7_IXOPE|nr:hypothetical protein HPB47_001168 [Ixodes persulcatus]